MESTALPPPLPGSAPTPTYRFSKLGFWLALAVIAGCAVFVIRKQAERHEAAPKEVRPNGMLEMLARYAVGVKGLMEMTGQSGDELTQVLMRDIDMLARRGEDSLRVLILKSWMSGETPAAAALDELVAKHPSLQPDVKTLKQWAASRDADEESWKELRRYHGWFASLARAEVMPKEAEARKQVVQQGIGTAVVLISATFAGMLLVVCGLVVLILGLLRWREGKMPFTLLRGPSSDGGVLTEGFAIYLALFILLPWLLHVSSVELPPWAGYGPALLAVLLGLFWPLFRGMKRSTWRETLGLHRGGGWFKEIGAGLTGWLAGLPLLAVGVIVASWITKLTGQVPTHPIVDVFAGSSWAKWGAVVLAVVWAPVSEEMMFRGLLFPGLSARWRWAAGAILSAFVFAVIHPQGWAGVPAIMALAIAFSMLRLWRRSLIAPMTAHALNNGLMCALMLMLW